MSDTVTAKPEKEGVFFVWQDTPRGPAPAVKWGSKPEVGQLGDRPLVVAVHDLSGELLDACNAALDQGGQAFPWAELKAKFPPPGGSPASVRP